MPQNTNPTALQLRRKAPPVGAFIQMRADCGWGEISEDQAQRALAGSLTDVTIWDGARVAGFGRLVGDGVLYFFLEDIVVHPDYRGRGLGRQIVQALTEYAQANACPGAMLMLMAAKGKEPFYERLGFTNRPTDTQGAGMSMFLGQ